MSMQGSLSSPGWHWEGAWGQLRQQPHPISFLGTSTTKQHLRGEPAQQQPSEIEEDHKENIYPPPRPRSLLLLHTCLLLSLCLACSPLLAASLFSLFLLCLLHLHLCRADLSVCRSVCRSVCLQMYFGLSSFQGCDCHQLFLLPVSLPASLPPSLRVSLPITSL